MRAHGSSRRGFSMLEVMTVLFILALLASIVLPLFQYSAVDAKDAILMRNLQYLRKQVELFRAQHGGRPPGFGGANPWLHLLFYTDRDGAISLVASPNHPFGPYISPSGVTNPFNDGLAVKISSNPSGETPDHSLTEGGAVVGWFYDPTTGRMAPNAEGTTSGGTSRIEL